MMDDWMDVIFRGHFEVSLPTLTISHEQTGACTGSGRLLWDGKSIRLLGQTDNAEGLLRSMGDHTLPGQLVPHSSYCTPTGQSQHGWGFTASSVFLDGFSVHGDSPHVTWDLPLPSVSFREQRSPTGRRTVRAILGPSPHSWTRVTETMVTNEFFGGSPSSLDWLRYSPQFGTVAARRRSAEWFEVCLHIDSTPVDDNATRLLNAVRWAFGFVMGRECGTRGHLEQRADATVRSIRTDFGPPTRRSLLPPFPRQWLAHHQVESLLACATNFFLTELGQTVANHLWLLWNTADNAIQTRQAMTSVCVEGLVRLVAGQQMPADHSQDRVALLALLEANPRSISNTFRNRLNGWLNTLSQPPSPATVLRGWAKSGILGVTSEDAEAWQRTRNSVVHANRVRMSTDRERLQGQLDEFDRVQNLLNRIVLHLMGYEGPTCNYSQPGWPTVHFPPLRDSTPSVVREHELAE